MHSKFALIFVFVIALGLVGSASAHKSEVVGNYKIEVGWKNEPPIVGIDNQIELTVTTATAFDKAEAEKEDQAMEGMDMGDTHDHSDMTGMNSSNAIHNQMSQTEMIQGKSAEDLIQGAEEMEKQSKYEAAAEQHHMAGELIHHEAEKLEQSGDYKTASDYHHQAAEQHHMAAMDLEKAGKFLEAADHHHQAAEHHNMAAKDLEKINMYAEAAEHHTQAADHHEMAAKDLQKAGMSNDAAEHLKESAKQKDLAAQDAKKVGTENSMDMTIQDTTGQTGHDHEMETPSQHIMGPAISSGIIKGFTADVILGDSDTPLNLLEDSKYPGVYHAKFMPHQIGFPMIHIAGNLEGENVDVTFHPEQVEPLNTLRPFQQIANGIEPSNVQCKEGYDLYLRTYDNKSSVCLHPEGGQKLMQLGLVIKF